ARTARGRQIPIAATPDVQCEAPRRKPRSPCRGLARLVVSTAGRNEQPEPVQRHLYFRRTLASTPSSNISRADTAPPAAAGRAAATAGLTAFAVASRVTF